MFLESSIKTSYKDKTVCEYGHHHRTMVSSVCTVLLQLPTEIQYMVFSYLDPRIRYVLQPALKEPIYATKRITVTTLSTLQTLLDTMVLPHHSEISLGPTVLLTIPSKSEKAYVLRKLHNCEVNFRDITSMVEKVYGVTSKDDIEVPYVSERVWGEFQGRRLRIPWLRLSSSDFTGWW
jgi:hypothetical protein